MDFDSNFFLGFAFLSKQVPAFYIFLILSIIIIIYLFTLNKIDPLKSILLGIILYFFLILLIFFGGIKFESFINQYILYPQSIGNDRFRKF